MRDYQTLINRQAFVLNRDKNSLTLEAANWHDNYLFYYTLPPFGFLAADTKMPWVISD